MLDPHEHIIAHVDAYLHELLTAEDAANLKQHCAACRICQVALAEAQRRLAALQSLPMIEASESLIQATQSRVDKCRPRWLTPVGAAWLAAAAVLLAMVGLNVYTETLSASSHDLKILGQSELVADSDASLRVLLVNHDDGQPLEGVPVDIELAGQDSSQFIHLASFVTDRWGSGSPRFRVPDWKDGACELRVSARSGRGHESITRSVKLKRSWQLMVTSDKPVYQPGQVIRLRSLALAQPQQIPVAGHDVCFVVRDPKGNVIFRKQDVTSRFGIASSDCPLADEIMEGPYQIQCEVGDTTSSLTVDVKKYVLPKFKIDIALDQPYYQPGQKVRGRVDARYFFGKPVENADVEIAVDVTDVSTTTVSRSQYRTDTTGSASFEFVVPERLIGREQLSGEASFTVHATVVDTGGQKQSLTASRVVADQPIRIEVICESGSLVRGVANKVYFFTSYLDGRPANTRITVSDIHQELTSNDLGVAVVEVTPESDKVTWTVHATDAEGMIGRRDVVLTCGKGAEDFLIRTDAAVYDAGQTLHILALGGGNEPVFLDVIRNGQTILTGLIAMERGSGQFDVDLPPDLFGTIELSAYRNSAAGLPVRKTQVIYVRQPGALKIETTLDRKEYRPGERARISFAVTDERHRPMPGALSVAAVDEAVFSVLGQAPGMERAFSALEQELLKPVYAIYPWTPDMLPHVAPKERATFEKALFARAGRRPVDRNALLAKLMEEYGERNTSVLDVLEREDLDQLMDFTHVPDELKSLLHGKNIGAYTLSATSYPTKVQQVKQQREKLENIMIRLWIAFLIIGVVVVLSSLLSGRRVVDCLVVICILGVLAGLMLPAVEAARESARWMVAANNVKQIGMAFENARRAGELPKILIEPGEDTAVRVRDWFPETLLWRPELITDDQGRATLDLDLADSITTWRLSASAVTAAGQLGAAQTSIRVFQPFFIDLNLPVALTRGDEVTLPVVVYNYLDKPQTVELTLTGAEWFELLGDSGSVQQVELAAGEVRSVGYRIRAAKIGHFELEVSARGSGVGDAVKRPIEVVSDGTPVEQVVNGTLQQVAEVSCVVPPDAIEGSATAILKIYPSSFSNVIEGLDAILQRPYGCFEQTSSTTYPNVLALDYLRHNNKSLPEVEAKARQYIHLGYQRLLGFEIAGGGFDWFGSPPAKLILTAYGLMEFTDMARVHDIDPTVIERTRKWLLTQRSGDGSWAPDGAMLHDDPTGSAGQLARLSTTAYVAWAVFDDEHSQAESAHTREYLLAHPPAAIDDPYTLALVAHALLAVDPSGTDCAPYLNRLVDLKESSDDGKTVWWASRSPRTLFYGAGLTRGVETTSLAALAMLRTSRDPATARKALAWIVDQRDPSGTWHSTQATILALKALLAGTGKPLSDGKPQHVEIKCDQQLVRDLLVPAHQADVVQQFDLSASVTAGSHLLTLTNRSDSAPVYQVSLRYYVPEPKKPADNESLSIELTYDKTDLSVNDTVGVTTRLVNKTSDALPMVILDLPIPAGFAMIPDDLEKLVAAGTIDKYQINPRSAVVYLRYLSPTTPLELQYRLQATMPVKVTVPAARAYEYYDPDRQVASTTAVLTVMNHE